MNEGIARYEPTAYEGLSEQQVNLRLEAGLFNQDSHVKTKSIGQIVVSYVCTLFNLINVLLATAIFLVGAYKNMLFLFIVIINTLIGIVQGIRAKKNMDALSIISSTKAKVIRNGQQQEIALDQVVLDDVLMLENGNQIIADCILLDGKCEVNESLLTGESDLVSKQPGDMLLSGSFIVSGMGRAKVEHVGKDNYAATISNAVKYMKAVPSQIMIAIKKVIKIASILILPLGLLLFNNQLSIEGNTLQRATVNTVAALIGMIPEGLVLLTSSVLAASVLRLSKQKVLVQELYCIENLARVDTLCLDKTGTITEGVMELVDIVPLIDHPQVPFPVVLGRMGQALQDHNPTIEAVRAKYPQGDGVEVNTVIPFSSDKKWSGVSFVDGHSYMLGAAEFILPPHEIARIKGELQQHSDDHRILVLSQFAGDFVEDAPAAAPQAIALVLLRDKIRAEAPAALEFFAEQDVNVKIISGDHPATVAGVARRAGVSACEQYIDMSQVEPEANLNEIAVKYNIFGRVSPIQKKQLVIALKEQGRTVAMTGDGVNDVMALREADCSIAMASGSDAARNVSQLVLLESNFAALPHVVGEGRQSINNLQRSSSLFLIKNIYSSILALIFVILPFHYPFMPIQLTLVNLVTIGIPSVVLAFEKNRTRVAGDFLKNMVHTALPGGLTVVANVVLVVITAHFIPLTQIQSSSLSVLLTVFTGFMLLYMLCTPFTALRRMLFMCCLSIFLLAILLFGGFFSIEVFDTKVLLLLMPLAFCSFVLFQSLLKLIAKKVE